MLSPVYRQVFLWTSADMGKNKIITCMFGKKSRWPQACRINLRRRDHQVYRLHCNMAFTVWLFEKIQVPCNCKLFTKWEIILTIQCWGKFQYIDHLAGCTALRTSGPWLPLQFIIFNCKYQVKLKGRSWAS